LEKLKIISIGGLESKIPDKITTKIEVRHWQNSRESIPNSLAPDAHAIVVITKFAGTQGRECARAASAHRGNIPILAAPTWNHVVPQIMECDKLYLWHHTLKNGDQPKKELAPAAPAKETTDQGVTPKELWEAYGDSLINVISTLFQPGEKMDVSEFLPIVAQEVGISEKDASLMLPYVAVAGILDNPVGDTWRLLGDEGFTLDLEPAPKPQPDSESHGRKILGLIKGLGAGPWKSKYAIESAMISSREFTSQRGTPLRRTMAYRYVRMAEEEGIVYAKDDAYWILHDPEVKLTPVPKEEQQPATRSIRRIPKKPDLKVSDDVVFLRSIVGTVSPPMVAMVAAEHAWEVVLGVKKMVPGSHWDKMAENAYFAILRKKGVSPKPIPKDLFQAHEWDALAWETLRGFKLEVMAPYFKGCFFDEKLKCVACGQEFLFTAADKLRHFEANVMPPRGCRGCEAK